MHGARQGKAYQEIRSGKHLPQPGLDLPGHGPKFPTACSCCVCLEGWVRLTVYFSQNGQFQQCLLFPGAEG